MNIESVVKSVSTDNYTIDDNTSSLQMFVSADYDRKKHGGENAAYAKNLSYLHMKRQVAEPLAKFSTIESLDMYNKDHDDDDEKSYGKVMLRINSRQDRPRFLILSYPTVTKEVWTVAREFPYSGQICYQKAQNTTNRYLTNISMDMRTLQPIEIIDLELSWLLGYNTYFDDMPNLERLFTTLLETTKNRTVLITSVYRGINTGLTSADHYNNQTLIDW